MTDCLQIFSIQAILSGPAGGVVGYARTTHDLETKQPVSSLHSI